MPVTLRTTRCNKWGFGHWQPREICSGVFASLQQFFVTEFFWGNSGGEIRQVREAGFETEPASLKSKPSPQMAVNDQ
jgi:hypothetical protein